MLASLLAFVTTGLGKMVTAAVAAVVIITGAYAFGRHEGEKAVRAEVAAVTAKEQARQQAASDAVLAAAQKRAIDADAETAALQSRVDQLIAEVQARPTVTTCLLGKDDAAKLSRIR